MIFSLILFFSIPLNLFAYSNTLKKEALLEIVKKKTTSIDLYGNGKKDFTRQYNSQGKLMDSVSVDRFTNPETTRHFKITDPENIVITFTQGKIIQKKIFEFYKKEHLIRREIFSTEDDSSVFKKKQVEEFNSFSKVEVISYELVNKKWKETRRYSRPAVYLQENPDGCLKMQLEEEILSVKLFSPILNYYPEVEEDQYVQLENGFKIYENACKDPAANEIIKEATDIVMNSFVGCLSQKNPVAALRFANFISEYHPNIQCGTQNPSKVIEKNCYSSSGRCASSIKELLSLSGAFYYESTHSLVLASRDPIGVKADVAARLASTLFHEMLHAINLEMDFKHNNQTPPFTDAVYGCEYLCAPPAANIGGLSWEGCNACITAVGYKPSRSEKLVCQNFLPNRISEKIYFLNYANEKIDRCLEGNHINCENLAKKEPFKEAFRPCASEKRTAKDPQCRQAIYRWIVQEMEEIEQMPGFDPAQVGFDWLVFKKKYLQKANLKTN